MHKCKENLHICIDLRKRKMYNTSNINEGRCEMIDSNKIRGKIREASLTQESVAKALEINASTLYRKLDGQSPFTVGEVNKLAKLLNLSTKDIEDIFF